MKILCVCMGNTCRSPMAQALLQQKAAAANLPLTVSSAGLAAAPGDPASAPAIRVAALHGMDLSAHRSAALTTDALYDTDAVFCMNVQQKAMLLRYIPAEKIFVPDEAIPDPYGGDDATYAQCFTALDAALERFLSALSVPMITPMSAADVPAVAAIEQQCFSAPWSADALSAELNNDYAHFYVLRAFGEIAGYIGVHLILDEGYITNVAVLPWARRRGYARTLLQTAVDFCRRERAAFLSLEVRKSNTAALRLYASLGFSERGERKNFYTDPAEDAWILTLDFDTKEGESHACARN